MPKKTVDSIGKTDSWQINAIIALADWSDPGFHKLLDRQDALGEGVRQHLQHTDCPAAIDVIASGPQRRKTVGALQRAWLNRSDEDLALAILTAVGPRPSARTCSRIRTLGMPRCLELFAIAAANSGKQHLSLRSDQRLALWRVRLAVDPAGVEPLAMAMRLLEDPRIEPEWIRVGLCAGAIPALESWTESIAMIDPSSINSTQPMPTATDSLDSHRRRVWALIRLTALAELDSPLGRAAMQLLSPLTMESLLQARPKLQPEVRRRLARLVIRLDPATTESIHDAIRHPVMQCRIDAIDWIEALNIIDLFADRLETAARDDHGAVRTRLAKAMASGRSEASERILKTLAQSVHGAVADAARQSLDQRRGGSLAVSMQ